MKKKSNKKTKKTNSSKNIEKEPEKKKKEESNTKFFVWISIIVIAALAVFIIAYNITSNAKKITPEKVLLEGIDTDEAFVYGGYPFIKQDDVWTTHIEVNGELFFIERQFSPREVENMFINYSPNNFSAALKKYRRVFVSIDPEDEGAQYLGTVGASIILSLKQVYGVTVIPACTKNSTECVNRPIANCEEAPGPGYPVIMLNYEETPQIHYYGNCLDLRGSGEDLIKAGDRVIYGWYGIMN